MASARKHAEAGAADRGADEVALGQVRRAAGAVRRARDAYRAALVAAVDELEKTGAVDAYARVAKAAGVSRQAVRTIVERVRANGS